LWHRLRALPEDDLREVPERERWMRPNGEPFLRGRHLRVPQGGKALLRMRRIPLRDNEEGSNSLWLLPVHIWKGMMISFELEIELCCAANYLIGGAADPI